MENLPSSILSFGRAATASVALTCCASHRVIVMIPVPPMLTSFAFIHCQGISIEYKDAHSASLVFVVTAYLSYLNEHTMSEFAPPSGPPPPRVCASVLPIFPLTFPPFPFPLPSLDPSKYPPHRFPKVGKPNTTRNTKNTST